MRFLTSTLRRKLNHLSSPLKRILLRRDPIRIPKASIKIKSTTGQKKILTERFKRRLRLFKLKWQMTRQISLIKLRLRED